MYAAGINAEKIAEISEEDPEFVRRSIGWLKRKDPQLQTAHEENRTEIPRNILETRWLENCRQTAAIVTALGKIPASTRSNTAEAKAALWLATQRKMHLAGKLAAWQVKELDAIPDWARSARSREYEDLWTRRLKELSSFRSLYGRLPRISSPWPDAHEKVLGIWLNSQRVNLRCGQLKDDRRNLLDQSVPDWFGLVA